MMKKFIAIAAVVLMLAGCADNQTAQSVLSAQGFTDIKITGYEMFGCSEDDTFHTGFTAKSVTGQQVRGVVCSSFLKGATVRFF